MSRSIYYSKVSMDSQEAYELVENFEIKRMEITKNILAHVKNNYEFEEVKKYRTEDGEEKEESVKYELSIHKKTDECIEGVLYKESILFVKEKDTTGEMKPRPVPNTEDIIFYYDVLHEYVAFIARKRFGYQMFNKAFAKMLSTSLQEVGYQYSFYLELFNSGMSIEEIQEMLESDGEIQELILTYRPVNPDEGIINKAKKAQEKEKLEKSNATERTVTYKAKGDRALNGNAEIIQDDLKFITEINPGLTMRELTQSGYISVTSKNRKGDVKTTAQKKPYIKTIDKIEDFPKMAKKGIQEILKRVTSFV